MTNIVEKIAESLREKGVSLSYGEKTSVDGKELIPVALVSYGFGGGSGSGTNGSDAEGSGEGEGGGGGGMSIPVGAYVGGPNEVRFQPNVIALMAVGIPLVWVTGKALAKIIKAF